MLDKMKQLYELQKKAKEIQKELRDTEVEACNSDRSVCVVYNGEQKIIGVKVGNPDLEKELMKVIAEATSKTQALAAEKTKDVMKDMGLNIPGM